MPPPISPTAVQVKPYARIFRVKVMLLNDRDFPLATATIPEFVIIDPADLITGAQALNPAIAAAVGPVKTPSSSSSPSRPSASSSGTASGWSRPLA